MYKRKRERVAIYIDGSNFYHYLKDRDIHFPKNIGFDFKRFVEHLVDQRHCISKRYYTGIFRNKDNSQKSQELVRGQQTFLANLENDGFTIKRGKIIMIRTSQEKKGPM